MINNKLPLTLDPLQFAYHKNRSTDDAITTSLHTTLSHLESNKSYVRMLFIDYSSAFNTIIPLKLDTKLRSLGLNPSLCSRSGGKDENYDFCPPDPQHRSPSGMRFEPHSLLSVHLRLRGLVQLQPSGQVRKMTSQ